MTEKRVSRYEDLWPIRRSGRPGTPIRDEGISMRSCQDDHRRIVITGIGVVCSAGRTAEQFWKTLTRTASGTRPGGAADFSGTIDDFGDLPADKRRAIRKSLKVMNRETQMGVAAGQQALADARILDVCDSERVGVCFGADNVSIRPDDFAGGIRSCLTDDRQFDSTRWGSDGLPEVAPLWLLKCLPNMPTCHLAIINDLRGPGNTITQRDVSANMAIAEAARTIRCGAADAVLVGATGTTLTAFSRLRARLEGDIDDEGICRPFDRKRTGPAPGEGAGALVLEDRDGAVRRGARIYGEIAGAAAASAVDRNRLSGCRKAAARALQTTLRQARLSPTDVGHVHAHGLGTPDSDLAESQAIGQVFGDAAAGLPIVAAKSHLANAASGAGILELIASLLAVQHGVLFPVLNCDEPDPECGVDPVTDRETAAGDSFLNVNLFGRGLASCVAVRAFAA